MGQNKLLFFTELALTENIATYAISWKMGLINALDVKL